MYRIGKTRFKHRATRDKYLIDGVIFNIDYLITRTDDVEILKVIKKDLIKIQRSLQTDIAKLCTQSTSEHQTERS